MFLSDEYLIDINKIDAVLIWRIAYNISKI